MWSDLRYAFRSLANSPVFSLTAVMALAIGIGANTAIFSLVNSVLLNPPGIIEPDRIVAVRVKYDKLNLKSISTSAPDFRDVRDSRETFSAAAVMSQTDFNYAGATMPERLVGARVTWQWFEVFGARPAHGRLFRSEEDAPGANQVAILSAAAWRRLFGGDPSVVGRTIELNKQPYRVVGVMGADFRWPAQADLWVPFGLAPEQFDSRNRHNQWLFTVARIKPGIPFDRANAAVKLLGQQVIQHEDERGYAKDSGWGMFAVPLLEFVAGDMRTPMLVLLGAVGFVLWIACSNIAGLLLARASSRSREIALRAALGAGRWRLIRQLLTESALLALTGGLLGLGLGWAGVRLLLMIAPARQAAGLDVNIDTWVLGFTAGISLVSGILFGLAPAWQLARADHFEALKEGGRSGTAGRARQRLRSALVTGEFALALVLLVGAGLFLRSFQRMQEVRTGFDPRGVMTAMVSLPQQQGDEAEERFAAFHRNVVERLSAVAGVRHAAAAIPLAFSGSNWAGSFEIEGRQQQPGDPGPHGDVRYITPGYFATMETRLLKGRGFTDQDRKGAEPVVVIDELLARQYWSGQEPLGQRLRRGNRAPWATIVGVVGHVRHSDLTGESNKGTYYFPMYQRGIPVAAYVVKTSGDPARLGGAMRDAVRSADPAQPLYDLKTMEERVAESLGPRRFAITLLSIFAAMALLLAAAGIYGVISYSVTQRTQEIGIRMALGAGRGEVLRMILGQGLRLAAAGAVAGLAAAAILSRLLASQLFQVGGFDPLTFTAMTAVLVAVALAACYVPARRATSVDAIEALRYE